MHKSIFVLTIFGFIAAALQPVFANEAAGRAEILTGTVTVERVGKQEVLKTGDPVFIKDRLLTGDDSSAEIALVDQSRIKLAAETSLEITEYQFNPAERIRYGLISLDCGKARFAVQDFKEFNDRRFRVLTGTAMIWSRDTDFIVSYDRELPRDEVCRSGLANALCLQNSIILSSLVVQDKPALLTAYMMSQVCGPNLPTPPRFATAAEFSRILNGLDQIGNPGAIFGDQHP